jgi:hypothetical protein
MKEPEMLLFIELLSSHRHLWVTFQTYRYLQEHPEVDWLTAHTIFQQESAEVYNSLADTLNEEQPIQDKLQTVLLQSKLTYVDVEEWLKKKYR